MIRSWLDWFRAKAPPPGTDAYRTAATVVEDEIATRDDDVEAPPVMVLVRDRSIGPYEIPRPSTRMHLVRGIVVLAISIAVVIFVRSR